MAAAADPENTIPVGNYVINLSAKLGSGGFGRVYMATKSDGQCFAAKELDLRRNDSSDIARETINFHRLPKNDKNIINVEDIKVNGTQIWIIMEMCDFGDLGRYFITFPEHVQSIQTKVIIMKQFMAGLAFLHDSDIIHRDIKPGNILIKMHPTLSNEGAVKITDFGLSKYIEAEDVSSIRTDNVGTHAFKPPELFDNDRNEGLVYQYAVDIFSAGLTALAMLQHVTGEPLVPGLLKSTASQSTPYIGTEMAARRKFNQPDVRFFEEFPEDDFKTCAVKKLIMEMTRFEPHERKSAKYVHFELCHLISAQSESDIPGPRIMEAQLTDLISVYKRRHAAHADSEEPDNWDDVVASAMLHLSEAGEVEAEDDNLELFDPAENIDDHRYLGVALPRNMDPVDNDDDSSDEG